MVRGIGGRRRVGVSAVALLVMVAACGGAATTGAGHRPELVASPAAGRSAAGSTPADVSAAGRGEARRDPSASPADAGRPFSFDDSVPRPRLEATGTDHAAIFRSLVALSEWAMAHHPDPALADEIFWPGTDAHDATRDTYRSLRDRGRRMYRAPRPGGEGDDALSVTVASVLDGVVSMRVDPAPADYVTVDRDGRVVSTRRDDGDAYLLVDLLTDGSGRWWIGPVTRVRGGEVRL